MKTGFSRSAIMIGLLLAWVALGAAQSVSNDLLQTGSGSQEDLSSLGLGTVSFQGVSLSTDTGLADTIVQHTPITQAGQINIQVIALHLQNTGTVTCGNQTSCGKYYNQSVTVHATINATGGLIPLTVLPQPDDLSKELSVGTMTVASGLTSFDSSFTNIQADIIVVPLGEPVTYTPIIFSKPGPSASMSANGGSLSSTAPPGYPTSQNFPTVGQYVTSLAAGSATYMFFTGPSGQMFRFSLWAFGGLLMVLALLMLRSGLKRGRMTLRPAYMAVLALAVCFGAWKTPNYPRIVQAASSSSSTIPCGPVRPESGTGITHGATPAQTGPCKVMTQPATPVQGQ